MYFKSVRGEGAQLVLVFVGQKDGQFLISDAEAGSLHHNSDFLFELGRTDVDERQGQTERNRFNQRQSDMSFLGP